ncbi:MAG: hypothetical protein JO121_10450 [Deltaproteobacteria bacterium]|nr:hypothetical protein [Deltaproteobacteria bacterium]
MATPTFRRMAGRADFARAGAGTNPWRLAGLVLLCAVSLPLTAVRADDHSSAKDLAAMRKQIEELQREAQSEQRRFDESEQRIRQLSSELRDMEAQNQRLNEVTQKLTSGTSQVKSETGRPLEELEQERSGEISASQFNAAFARYLGTHQFTLVGDAAVSFIYDRATSQNTFTMQFQPILLYRMSDWLLFEGSIAASLPVGSNASFSLPVATAQIFLNDYLQINAGIFDQPFGDWYEDQSPVWVNRLITAPLPYGVQAIVPPTDLGLQLRGSTQWGELGQDVDYTTWIANGPSFDSTLPQPVVGQSLNPQNNIGINTNGRALGARFRIYPFPLDANLGRLELGASTYDGKWQDSFWFNSWGVDFAYLNHDLQARGEWIQTYRQMPAGSGGPDNRQGWYFQLGYFLRGLPTTGIASLDDVVHRLEPVARYSGVNQRAIVTNEISAVPSLGFNGSSSIFTPHAREVALGLNYWIEPSIVWQTEFDLELPRAGGTAFTFNHAQELLSQPASTPNDRALLTQLSIGF